PVVALARLPAGKLEDIIKGSPLLLIGDELQDPGNLGTMLRSAEAFGVSAILLTKGSVNPRNPKVIRSSAGSIFRMPCLAGLPEDTLFNLLSHHGFRMLAATVNEGVDFRDMN